MFSFSDSNTNLLLYFTYALFFFFAGQTLFRTITSLVEESQEDKLAPVKLSSSHTLRRLINPARWRGSGRSVAGQAYVRQAYPILRRGAGRFLVKFSVRGGAFGIRNPFRTQPVHYDVIWYQYEVNGAKFWGKFQFPVGFETLEQATAIAHAVTGKTIPIHYDPNTPEDSKPAFASIARLVGLPDGGPSQKALP